GTRSQESGDPKSRTFTSALRGLARDVFVVGMPGAVAAGVALAAVKYSLGESVAKSEWFLAGILLLAVLVSIIGAVLSAVLRRRRWQELAYKTGIEEVYPGFSACEKEILSALKKAKDTRIFLQLGKSVLSGPKTIYQFLE